jgi:hypothetical protein
MILPALVFLLPQERIAKNLLFVSLKIHACF